MLPQSLSEITGPLLAGERLDALENDLTRQRSGEPLGERIVEMPDDEDNYVNRDQRVTFTAYVPPGSVARGAALVKGEDAERAPACAACHGDNGKGKRDLGAPDLTDKIWLYGSEKDTIVDGLWNGRGGVMPAWAGRLDDTTIKALTVYVHTLGGGER